MSLIIEFCVPGVPQTKGCAMAFVVGGRARITNDNPKAKTWQGVITTLAMHEMRGRPPVKGGVQVFATCVFARPKSHLGTGKNADIVKDSAPSQHLQKPDADKVARPILDALTGVVYSDDSEVFAVQVKKLWGRCNSTRIAVYGETMTERERAGE